MLSCTACPHLPADARKYVLQNKSQVIMTDKKSTDACGSGNNEQQSVLG